MLFLWNLERGRNRKKKKSKKNNLLQFILFDLVSELLQLHVENYGESPISPPKSSDCKRSPKIKFTVVDRSFNMFATRGWNVVVLLEIEGISIGFEVIFG